MPYGSRAEQRMQAKIQRITGQVIWLLIPPASSSSTDTPLSISAADTPVDLTECTKVKVYATVSWKSGQFTFGEGGQTLMKVAEVTIPFDYSTSVVAAYAIQTSDGEVLLKKSQDLNESQTMYVLNVESYIATQQ